TRFRAGFPFHLRSRSTMRQIRVESELVGDPAFRYNSFVGRKAKEQFRPRRIQASYELARTRRKRAAAQRRSSALSARERIAKIASLLNQEKETLCPLTK
ncbi:MAG: hypothetical protein OXN84_16575, partial [Albidovulum sp.]|nr:hypothetical protein [Albidovulum sp.]